MRALDIIAYFIYHCTGSSQQATIAAIVNYWKNTLKWKWGGYHIIFDVDGTPYFYVVEGNTYRYDPDPIYFPMCLSYITNGVGGYNHNGIHIAYVGGKHGDDRTKSQKESMYIMTKKILDLLPKVALKKLYIGGHRDLSKDKDGNGIITPNEWSKSCPAFETISWLNQTGLYTYYLNKL